MLRSKQLNIRISTKDYELLQQLALERKKTISEFIRELVEKEEKERRKIRFEEARAFGREFAKERGINEEDVIEAIMESRYGKDWERG